MLVWTCVAKMCRVAPEAPVTKGAEALWLGLGPG